MLNWIVVFIVFSVLILIHEAGHLFAAKKAGIRVEAFSLGMGKRLFGVKIGETDYRLSLIPFGGFCQMAGEEPGKSEGREYEFSAKPPGHRFWVVSAGSLTNYVFAFFLFAVVYMIGVPTLSNEVGKVLDDFPAAKAGIEKGDRIISINGEKVEYWEDILASIRGKDSGSGNIDMRVDRGGKVFDLKVDARVREMTNIFGQKIKTPVIGIAPEQKILSVSYGPLKSFVYGGKRLLYLTGMTYKGIWMLVTGAMPVKGTVSGPVGIAGLIMQATDLGVVHIIMITAHISMALAIFNLLPFPILDGGHVIFLGFEKLRGKPVSVRFQELATNVALFLLIGFAIFVTFNDIIRMISDTAK